MSDNNPGHAGFLPGIQKPPHRSQEYMSQQGRSRAPPPRPLHRQSSTHQWRVDVTESASSDTATPRVDHQSTVPSFSLDPVKQAPEEQSESHRESLVTTTNRQAVDEPGQTESEHYDKSQKYERKKRKSARRKSSHEKKKTRSFEAAAEGLSEGLHSAERKADTPQAPDAISGQGKESQMKGEFRQNSLRYSDMPHKKSSDHQSDEEVPNRNRRKSVASLRSQTSRRSWVTGRGKPTAMSPETKRSLNQSFIASYIYSNIKQLECHAYIRDKSSDVDRCLCGREVQWHRRKGIDVTKDTSSTVWDPRRHAVRQPCHAFGEILFRGFGIQSNRTTPYMRVAINSNMEKVWTVLTGCWQLPVPKLLISITGGAKRFHLRPRLKTILKQGLVNAAVTTGAWIITGGTATGVMELVGEAVQDHMHTSGSYEENQCIALGIASWGAVANNAALDGPGYQGLFPAPYCMEDITVRRGLAPLNHNHTHFLLVDDGSEFNFGVSIQFRSRLLSYISQKVETGVTESQSVNVPSVLIVVEGGLDTMKTARESIKSNMPVVVIKGSGRAADFIAAAFHLTKNVNDEDQTVYPADFEEIMFAKARVLFEWKTEMPQEEVDNNICETLHYLEDCLEDRKLINIFNLDKADSEKDIDRAILYALLRANKYNANSQLALALAWNRCDIANQEIFTSKNRHVWQQADLYNAMFTALVQNRADFVQLFLDNGVDLKLFLNTRTLWNLYCNCIVDPSDAEASLLRYLISRLKQTWAAFVLCRGTPDFDHFPDLLPFINKVIVHLLQDQRFSFYTDAHIVSGESPTMTWKGDLEKVQPRSTRFRSKHAGSEEEAEAPVAVTEAVDFEHPERELFIWAVLFNRRELSHLFWKSGKDHLGGALFSSALLYKLSSLASKEEEEVLSVHMAKLSDDYERWAVQVLSECYSHDKLLTHRLLVRDLGHWGHSTLFSLAELCKQMEFVDHSACQTKLSSIWKGRMALYTSQSKIFFCTVLPFLIPFIKFTIDPKVKDDEDELFEDDDDSEEEPADDRTLNAGGKRSILLSNRVRPESLPDSDGDGLGFVPSPTRHETRILAARLKKVNLFDFRTDNMNILSAIYFFYEAPVTKFFSNLLAYLVFMALFTYMVLVKLGPADEEDSPSLEEYLTWGWVITLVMEEFRQMLMCPQKSLKNKAHNWFRNFWNCFDAVIYLLFLLSIILRFTLSSQNFVGARVTYSVTLTLFFLRSMQFFYAEPNMGPKIIMIRRMLKDLLFFFLILLVFMVSFGAAFHANLFPQSPPSFAVLVNILYYPYFQMYGELFLEEMQGEDVEGCTHNESIWREDILKRCPQKNAVVPILLAVYMIITHVLLINLLIAMFSYTFQMVQENSTRVWRFNRLSLVSEYCDRPALFPPLIIFAHGFRLLCWVWSSCTGSSKRSNVLHLELSEPEHMRLTLFEKNAVDSHLSLSRLSSKYTLESRVSSTAVRLETVMDELERIKEFLQPSDAVRTSLSLPSQFDPDRQTPGSSTQRLQRDRELMDRPPLISQLSDKKSKSPAKDVESLDRKVDGVIAQTAAMSQRLNQLTRLLESSLATKHKPA